MFKFIVIIIFLYFVVSWRILFQNLYVSRGVFEVIFEVTRVI